LREHFHDDASATRAQQSVIESFYNRKPVMERQAIEAKARFLRTMLTAPRPLWLEMKVKYEIYPRTSFATQAAYSEKHREWFRNIGLDVEPFYLNPSSTVSEQVLGEGAEMARCEMEATVRAAVEEKVRRLRTNPQTPVQERAKKSKMPSPPPLDMLKWWTAVDAAYGLSQADFGRQFPQYHFA
jgi:hypothetical protein